MVKAARCALEGRTGHQAGRALLAQLYRMETGQTLPPILISETGKPYFEDSPYHFSISHTRYHAFCVLSSAPVGIDAEEADRPFKPALVQRVLSPGELLRYRESANRQRAFLSLWVLKEASAKQTGLGLRGFPNHTDFSPEDGRVFQWGSCLVAILGGDEGVTLYDF